MDNWPSIKSCNRARTTERGFALAMALIIAVLYFGLIELMLFDASRELAEARRFRARIVALTLAESGAELAALRIVENEKMEGQAADWQGEMTGRMNKNGAGEFAIHATGRATGVVEMKATVEVYGVVDGTDVQIRYTYHSQ